MMTSFKFDSKKKKEMAEVEIFEIARVIRMMLKID
jgi:hypothetical protein